MTLASATGADWLAAIATALAVVVALGIQLAIWARERHRRPALTLEYQADDAQVELDEVSEALPSVRLRVANQRGKEGAEGVEVLVRHVARQGREIRLGNSPLVWTNRPGHTEAMVSAVSPGIYRFVDLGYIVAEQIGHAEFEIALARPPRDPRHVLSAGEYMLELAVVASNCDATFWNVRLKFSGDIKWEDEDDVRAKVEIAVAPSAE